MSKIIPITKATRNIQPPLKKSELVEALAIREIENIKKEQAEIAKQIEVTTAELYNPSLVDVIRKEGKTDKNRNGEPFRISVSYEASGREASALEITLSLPATAEVRRLYRKLRDLENKRLREIPSMHQVKQGIAAKMAERATAGQRVAALLKNPETSKALDETLAALKKPTQLQLTA